MKIVIIGDIHFGAGYSFGRPDSETGINSRLLDYEKTLANIVTYVISKKIELCVMLGDIFETRNPSPQQIVMFYRQLKRLSDANVTTYVIMGNHDYIKTRKITSSLDPLKELHIPNIYIFNDIDLVQFTDSNNEMLNVLLCPYRNRQSYDKATNEEAIVEISKEMRIAKNKMMANVPSIACSHMMMENTISADAGEYGINELILPFEIFNGIDIVINGHIHRASILQEYPLFIYSGSMECKDFSEKEHQKCFLIYDTQKSGVDAVSFKAIETRKFIDFELDYSIDFPEAPMDKIVKYIVSTDIKDAVVRFSIKVPETKISTIDTSIIRSKFHELGVNCVSDISVSPVILRQLRNQKVNDAPDDVSAFKHYISSQTNIDDNVLSIGLNIINMEIDS